MESLTKSLGRMVLKPAKLPALKKDNKGVGAGGANTNFYGKRFEEFTDNEPNLIKNDYTVKILNKNKYGYYLIKQIENKSIVYVSQGGLIDFYKFFHNIELFRHPDEAYIITENDNVIVKILEKKEQNVEGSVDIKLWSSIALKREYELMLPDCKIEYSFCLSSFFKTKFESKIKKWEILKQILDENDIRLFYGEDPDYFHKIDEWILT